MFRKAAALIALLIVLFLLLWLSVILFNNKSSEDKPNSSNSDTTSTVSQVESQISSSPKVDTSKWNYILVNSDHPLDPSFTPVTKELPNQIQVDERIYDSLMQMLEDARAEGLEPVVCSGYRPYETQQRLFNENIASLKAQGYSEDEAYKLTAQEVAVPGTSEHQTGLAVDIVALEYQLLDEKVMETDEVAWLYANCHKYGFIVRYPEGKKDITKIIYEPWHYRYVGVEAATEIMERGICYEEYVEE